MADDFPMSRRRNPFMEYNDIEIESISPDHSVLKCTLSEHSQNPFGMIHGGLLYTMMDCVAGITARADGHKYVTQSVYCNYLSNVNDQDVVFAESEVIRRGRTVCVFHTFVRTKDGKVLSDGTVDMFRVDN